MPILSATEQEELQLEPQKKILNSGLRIRSKPKPSPEPIGPHAVMRKKAHDRIVMAHRVAAAIPWAGVGILAIFGMVSAISYRTDIVRAWPKSASAFAAIGKPANLYGIDIGSVQARAGMDTKGPRVLVSGVLASVSRKPEPVAYLKVSLVDARGAEKLSWMVDPGITVLAPGARHVFETARSNPVRGTLKAQVVFAEPPPSAPRPPPEPPTGKTGLMGANGLVPATNSPPNPSSPETITAR